MTYSRCLQNFSGPIPNISGEGTKVEASDKVGNAVVAYFSVVRATSEYEPIATRFLEQLSRDKSWTLAEVEEVKRLIQDRLQMMGHNSSLSPMA